MAEKGGGGEKESLEEERGGKFVTDSTTVTCNKYIFTVP